METIPVILQTENGNRAYTYIEFDASGLRYCPEVLHNAKGFYQHEATEDKREVYAQCAGLSLLPGTR